MPDDKIKLFAIYTYEQPFYFGCRQIIHLKRMENFNKEKIVPEIMHRVINVILLSTEVLEE